MRNSRVDPGLLAELAKQGIKHTAENVVAIARHPSGKIVFLETGKSGIGGAGLAHVVEQHGTGFARCGIAEADIPDVLIRALTQGNVVGTQGTRPVYEVDVDGVPRYIAVTVGNNGFIVGANPASLP